MGLRARDVIVLIAVAFLFFMVGYASGVYTTIEAVISISKHFIEVDPELIQKAIFQYENNIGCMGNISI